MQEDTTLTSWCRINFEDTFDDLNDETFGGGPQAGKKEVGRDFDFFGRTAQVSNAIDEEQARYQRQQPRQEVKKPARSGYEKYQQPGYVRELQVDANIWGQGPSQPAAQAAPISQAAGRKMMTLEEIEAQMSGQPPQPVQAPQVSYQQQSSNQPPQIDPRAYQQAFSPQAQPQILQRPPQQQQVQAMGMPPGFPQGQQPQGFRGPAQPQRPGGQQAQAMGGAAGAPLMQMTEEDKAAFLAADAKRAKRNHKIYELSRDNGIMTPQDKNFITRIQLQQLMAATGGIDDRSADSVLSEDFYYQVITSIRGGPRQNPSQPLSHFAQTYLFQTGGRMGGNNRRNNRADNHMQRMEQQVQRAVEAAKLKPKNKQLVLEGSLGKISFSNAKTPKPLLNIRRHDSADLTKRPSSKSGPGKELSIGDRKTILKNIEVVYSTLMRLEDEARKEPFMPPDVAPTDYFKEAHSQWDSVMGSVSSQLWDELKVLEPINAASAIPHPFIAFLSHGKGKKAIPRIFRYLNSEQRVTMLTMIVIHLDHLDVIRNGAYGPADTNLTASAKESIELFSMTVTQALFGYVSEAQLFIIIGFLGLILDRVQVTHVAQTKVGLSILTMLTARATLIKEAGEAPDDLWGQWTENYDKLFNTLQPTLASIFPPNASRDDDEYAWQFLAAVGSGASPEQQQALVIGVKDRVMDAVSQSKSLPPDMAMQKRARVNLFMRAIGLDVDLLE